MTETALAELLSQDLSGLDLVALMIDGVHFAETCCIVALGIDIEGTKHPLALVEGSTENATLVTGLLVGLRERGLDVTRPMLVGLDGSKALRKAVVDVLDHPVIQRCQLHKIRNVKDHLPQRLRSSVGRRMTDAYHADSALEAEAALLALANELDRTHPGAAASLREGLDETLTVLRLGVPPTLARTLRSTNCIESMISVCREHAANVKRWRDGQMALRWCAAGMVEAGKQFRRVNGHLHLPSLRAALEREIAEPVGPDVHNDEVSAACRGLGKRHYPGEYAAGVQRLLDAHPGAYYLRTDQTCPSLRQATAEGNPIYAVLELGGTTHGEGVCCGSCRRRRRLRKVVGYNN